MKATILPLTLELTARTEVTVAAEDVTAKTNTAPLRGRYFIDVVLVFNRLFDYRRVSEGSLHGSRAYAKHDTQYVASADLQALV